MIVIMTNSKFFVLPCEIYASFCANRLLPQMIYEGDKWWISTNPL